MEDYLESRLRWEDNKSIEFKMGMTEKSAMINKIGRGTQEKWDKIIGAIWEVANDLKMI